MDPLRGYLLTVNISPDMAGKTVTVAFQPPGWTVELASIALALLLGAVWSVAHTLIPRRRTAVAAGISEHVKVELTAGPPLERRKEPVSSRAGTAPHQIGASEQVSRDEEK